MENSFVTSTKHPDHEVVVLGGGFSGVGTGVKLRQAGVTDFVILEQADDVGGTWRDNTYPGVGVDIPSFTYQFSFEMNPDWSRVFAPGAEVRSYLDHCIDKYDLRRHVRLNTRVTEAVWDEQGHFWRIHHADGLITARFMVIACGSLTQPKLPDIPGLSDFRGTVIHSAQWDHGHDLTGERVAVVGTGASAVQIVPALAPQVGHLDVYQRTPIWVLPKPDARIPPPVGRVFRRFPVVQNAVRLCTSALLDMVMITGVIHNRQLPLVARSVEALGRAWIRMQVRDPGLRRELTPTYGFGCKRHSMSNDYLRTFNRADVDLVTTPIDRVTETGVRTADGAHREVDTLVLATGFYLTEPENSPPVPVTGRDGLDLRRFWQEQRFQAYQGASVPKVPNAFMTSGPYAAVAISWMFMIENQTSHAVRVITEARRRGATLVEVRQEPHDAFFTWVQKKMRNTVYFNNGCGSANSIYFDRNGDVPFVRPQSAVRSWWRSRHFDLDDYRYERSRWHAPTEESVAVVS